MDDDIQKDFTKKCFSQMKRILHLLKFSWIKYIVQMPISETFQVMTGANREQSFNRGNIFIKHECFSTKIVLFLFGLIEICQRCQHAQKKN